MPPPAHHPDHGRRANIRSETAAGLGEIIGRDLRRHPKASRGPGGADGITPSTCPGRRLPRFRSKLPPTRHRMAPRAASLRTAQPRGDEHEAKDNSFTRPEDIHGRGRHDRAGGEGKYCVPQADPRGMEIPMPSTIPQRDDADGDDALPRVLAQVPKEGCKRPLRKTPMFRVADQLERRS